MTPDVILSFLLETCQSGLTCFFAKEVSPLKGSEGSNPSVSAKQKTQEISCVFCFAETSRPNG